MRFGTTSPSPLLIAFLPLNSIHACYIQLLFLPLVKNYFDEILMLVDGDNHETNCQSTQVEPGGSGTHFAVMPKVTNSLIANLKNSQSITAIVVSSPNCSAIVTWVSQLSSVSTRNFFFFILLDHGVSKQLEFLAHLASSHFLLDSNLYWIVYDGSTNYFTLWESYAIKGIGFLRPILEKFDERHLPTKLVASKWRRRRDFNGIAVIATAADDEAYYEEVKFVRNPGGGKSLGDSIGTDVYRIFKDYLHFSERSIEGAYMLDTSPPPGLERMQVQLFQGQADISIALSVLEEEKSGPVHFLHPVTATWLEVRFKGNERRWKFLARPFEGPLWLAVFVYAVILIAVMACIRYLVFLLAVPGCQKYENNTFGLNTLWSLSTICLQDWYERPRVVSVQIVFLVAALAGLILNKAYSGGLTAQLSVHRPPPVTLEKLLNRKYEFGLEEDVSFPIALENFPDVQVQTIEDAYELDALKAVAAGKLAWILFPEHYHSVAETANLTDAEACSLCKAVRATSTRSLSAMALNRTSDFKEIFNILTLKLMGSGILRHLFVKYKGERLLKCDGNNTAVLNPTVLDLSLSLAILFSGCVVSAAILFLESSLRLFQKRVYRHSFR